MFLPQQDQIRYFGHDGRDAAIVTVPEGGVVPDDLSITLYRHAVVGLQNRIKRFFGFNEKLPGFQGFEKDAFNPGEKSDIPNPPIDETLLDYAMTHGAEYREMSIGQDPFFVETFVPNIFLGALFGKDASDYIDQAALLRKFGTSKKPGEEQVLHTLLINHIINNRTDFGLPAIGIPSTEIPLYTRLSSLQENSWCYRDTKMYGNSDKPLGPFTGEIDLIYETDDAIYGIESKVQRGYTGWSISKAGKQITKMAAFFRLNFEKPFVPMIVEYRKNWSKIDARVRQFTSDVNLDFFIDNDHDFWKPAEPFEGMLWTKDGLRPDPFYMENPPVLLGLEKTG